MLRRACPSEFGAAPKIRGSLNFGPVIVGEIGDIKRAIVFNGDTMNTAARLEELSRTVEGGFLAAREAIERFDRSCCRSALRDLGAMPIRGRVDAIAVMGLDQSDGGEARHSKSAALQGGSTSASTSGCRRSSTARSAARRPSPCRAPSARQRFRRWLAARSISTGAGGFAAATTGGFWLHRRRPA